MIVLAKSEKVLPAIQITIGSQMTGFEGNVDHKSGRLSRTADVRNPKKTWENLRQSNLNSRDQRNINRELSVDSQQSNNDYAIICFNLTLR